MAFLKGVRFQKRISVLPGVKINLSKTGVSSTVGGRGASVNVGMTGRRTINLGIPGTGLSYRAPLGGTMLLLIVAAVVVVGIAYFLAPDLVKAVLHAWQPKWF